MKSFEIPLLYLPEITEGVVVVSILVRKRDQSGASKRVWHHSDPAAASTMRVMHRFAINARKINSILDADISRFDPDRGGTAPRDRYKIVRCRGRHGDRTLAGDTVTVVLLQASPLEQGELSDQAAASAKTCLVDPHQPPDRRP